MNAARPAFPAPAVATQLQASLEGILLTVATLPEEWLRQSPGGILRATEEGSWSASVQLAHVLLYEELLGAPVCAAIAAGGDGRAAVAALPTTPADWYQRRLEALAAAPLPSLIARLRTVRAAELATLHALTPAQWQTPITPVWRTEPSDAAEPLQTPGWVFMKTVQHTWEHANSIALIGLRLTLPRQPESAPRWQGVDDA